MPIYRPLGIRFNQSSLIELELKRLILSIRVVAVVFFLSINFLFLFKYFPFSFGAILYIFWFWDQLNTWMHFLNCCLHLSNSYIASRKYVPGYFFLIRLKSISPPLLAVQIETIPKRGSI